MNYSWQTVAGKRRLHDLVHLGNVVSSKCGGIFAVGHPADFIARAHIASLQEETYSVQSCPEMLIIGVFYQEAS